LIRFADLADVGNGVISRSQFSGQGNGIAHIQSMDISKMIGDPSIVVE
jgi:hypothetical protein